LITSLESAMYSLTIVRHLIYDSINNNC